MPGSPDAQPGADPGAPRDSSGAPAPSSERRLVSVLFADLVAFTTLTENEDAEQVRELLSRYFEIAQQVVEGYGGTIEKFIGDAVMAIWGAPVAREDDAERAVRAALDLVERVRGLSISSQALQLRAAVMTGEAAVTLNARGQGMVAGDLVNTASRLQSVAPAGVVLVGETAYQATSAAIAYEPAGTQLLKGKQAPVAAWRALRVVARVGGGGRDEGLEPPFVGREEELRLLKEQVHAAEREQRLRMVAIYGQAGIGKSRLLWELEKYLDGLVGPPIYYWHQGRSPSYGEGIAFWALGEMVRRRAGIAEDDDEPTTRGKLRAAVETFVADPAERRWLEPALGGLLGIDEADWAAREQLFSAWRTFFERVAEQGPAVLAFEDLQWADDGLLDFVEHLLEWARDKPILIVTLARPELLERRPNFGLGHRALVALHLEPLSDAAMGELLAGLVPALGEADLARVTERAEGVPLYAVELLRSLADAGHLVRRGDVYEPIGELPALDTPPTLRALIASRLDALDLDDRRLLQDASVLGSTFAMPALADLLAMPQAELEPRLRSLAQKELVSLDTDPRSPERGQYRFRQGLICETAYGTLARRERRALHLAAARYLDTLDDEELAGVKATHYLEAFRAAPEGEEGAAVAAQARVALRAAAERGSRLHSHVQALTYYEQALAVTFEQADMDDLHARAAHAAWFSGDLERGEAHARAAIDSLWQRGETSRAARLTAFFAGWKLEQSEIDAAAGLAREALERLPPDAEGDTVELYNQLARAHLFKGEGDAALRAITRALDTAQRLQVSERTLDLVITKAWALAMSGRVREGQAMLTGAMVLADREDDLMARLRTRFNASSYLTHDEPHYALEIAREGIAIAEQFGVALPATSMRGNAAHSAFMLGRLDDVLQLALDVESASTTLGTFVRGYAAAAHALRGDDEASRAQMGRLDAALASSSSEQDRATHELLQAVVAFGRGELEEAHQLAIDSRERYNGGEAPYSTVIAAHSSTLLGDAESLRADLVWFEQNAMTGAWADRLAAALRAGLQGLDGARDEAAVAYRRAIADLRAADLPFDLALTLIGRAAVLGLADTEAAEGRAEARQILAGMGAEGLMERLEGAARRPTAESRRRAPRAAQQQERAAPTTR